MKKILNRTIVTGIGLSALVNGCGTKMPVMEPTQTSVGAQLIAIDVKKAYQVGEPFQGEYSVEPDVLFDGIIVIDRSKEGIEYKNTEVSRATFHKYNTFRMKLSPFSINENGNGIIFSERSDSFNEPGTYNFKITMYDCGDITNSNTGLECRNDFYYRIDAEKLRENVEPLLSLQANTNVRE